MLVFWHKKRNLLEKEVSDIMSIEVEFSRLLVPPFSIPFIDLIFTPNGFRCFWLFFFSYFHLWWLLWFSHWTNCCVTEFFHSDDVQSVRIVILKGPNYNPWLFQWGHGRVFYNFEHRYSIHSALVAHEYLRCGNTCLFGNNFLNSLL